MGRKLRELVSSAQELMVDGLFAAMLPPDVQMEMSYLLTRVNCHQINC